METTVKENPHAAVYAWNNQYCRGTAVWAWPGDLNKDPVATVTEGDAYLLGGTNPVVKVAGYSCIALTHVKPVDLDDPADVARYDSVESGQRHEANVKAARKEFAEALAAAVTVVGEARKVLAELRGNDLYDVEYAEGGDAAADMARFLDDAERALRVVRALNRPIELQR